MVQVYTGRQRKVMGVVAGDGLADSNPPEGQNGILDCK